MEHFWAAGLLLVLLIGLSHSYTILKLGAQAFDNPSGTNWNNDCCDVCFEIRDVPSPAAACDTVLQICLTRADHVIFSSGKEDEESCAYYQHTTREHTNMDSINLSRYVGEITINIDNYEGSLQIGVYAEDADDSFIPNEKIDIHRVIINDVPDNCERRQLKRGTSNGMRGTRETSFQYIYQLYCACGYYGPSCSTMCTPRNDNSGHYTCDQNTGHKICLQGWTGNECRIREDDCYSHACQNEATCVDGEGSYQCICTAGYAGTYCEIPIDECASAPCLYGNCTDLDDSYVCVCDVGYKGQQCQSHVCNDITCLNGGVCNDYGTCDCPSHTSGYRCELTVPPSVCSSQPCMHGGKCMAGSRQDGEEKQLFGEGGRGYTCVCLEQYTGLFCEKQREDVTAAVPPASQDGSTSQAVFSGLQIGLYVCGILLVMITIIIVSVAYKRNPRNEDEVRNVTTIPMVNSDAITTNRNSYQSIFSIDSTDGAINSQRSNFIYLRGGEEHELITRARYGVPLTARSAHYKDDSSDRDSQQSNTPQGSPTVLEAAPCVNNFGDNNCANRHNDGEEIPTSNAQQLVLCSIDSTEV